MHAEIKQVGHGAYPECGMALEPTMPGRQSDDDGELPVMCRRFWLLVTLTLPVFVLAREPHPHG